MAVSITCIFAPNTLPRLLLLLETPTVWGRYDRAIVTSGLSKAYGLPGLRIGWVVGPPALVEELRQTAPSLVEDDRANVVPGDRVALIVEDDPALQKQIKWALDRFQVLLHAASRAPRV